MPQEMESYEVQEVNVICDIKQRKLEYFGYVLSCWLYDFLYRLMKGEIGRRI